MGVRTGRRSRPQAETQGCVAQMVRYVMFRVLIYRVSVTSAVCWQFVVYLVLTFCVGVNIFGSICVHWVFACMWIYFGRLEAYRGELDQC